MSDDRLRVSTTTPLRAKCEKSCCHQSRALRAVRLSRGEVQTCTGPNRLHILLNVTITIDTISLQTERQAAARSSFISPLLSVHCPD
jgi:hypothetical protein